ncbi:MAG: type II toxin-antitoxin system RelE/ParE family toxin [Taibaiella sp.]|nr:type II toxin-antitoxin system RelE/ParE family toxin [Taibaiella sp.]
MSYRIEISGRFDKEIKRLLKKFPSLRAEFAALVSTLREDPLLGTPIGNDCYKIRLAIASKGRGKSGGARIITYVYVAGAKVYLLSIYDKSEQSDISDKDLLLLLNGIR